MEGFNTNTFGEFYKETSCGISTFFFLETGNPDNILCEAIVYCFEDQGSEAYCVN